MSLVNIITSDNKKFSLTTKQVKPLTVIRNMIADLPDDQVITLPIHSVPFSAAVMYSDVIYDTFEYIGASTDKFESKLEVIEPQLAAMIHHYAEHVLEQLGFEELDNMRIPIPIGNVQVTKDGVTTLVFTNDEVRDKAFVELNDKLNDKTYVDSLDEQVRDRCWLRRKYHGLLYALDKLGSDLPYHLLNEYIHARLMKTDALTGDNNDDKLDFEAMWLANPLFTLEEKAKFIETSKYILEEPEPWYLMNNPYAEKYIESKTNDALKTELRPRTEKFRENLGKLATEVGLISGDLPKTQLSTDLDQYKQYKEIVSSATWNDYPNTVFGHPLQPPVKFPDIPEPTDVKSSNNSNVVE